MLGIALGAVVLGCILMLWILWRHDFSVSVSAIGRLTAPVATVLGLPVESLIRS